MKLRDVKRIQALTHVIEQAIDILRLPEENAAPFRESARSIRDILDQDMVGSAGPDTFTDEIDEVSATRRGTATLYSNVNEEQVGGDHYAKHGHLQPWDVIAHFDLNYFAGNAVKYVLRYRDKNGVEDLRKAVHYLQKLIEQEDSK